MRCRNILADICRISLPMLVVISLLASPNPTLANESKSAVNPITFNPTQPLTLSGAISLALANYPSIRVAQARYQAARSNIGLAKTAYLPRLDLNYEEIYGTVNESLGIQFPPLAVPAIFGPPQAKRTYSGVWAASTSSMFTLELTSFGLRRSQVGLARAEHEQSGAQVALTRLDVAVSAADAFLSVVQAQLMVRTEEANVARFQTVATAVQALVDADLRPGVDASRADAELALARDELIRAQQSTEIALANLAECLGLAGMPVSIDAGVLSGIPANTSMPTFQDIKFNPLAVTQQAAVKTVMAKETVINHEWRPHIYFRNAFFARGSGAHEDGTLTDGGFLPNVPNYAVAITANFPILDIFEIRMKKQIEQHNEQAERANYDVIMQTLKGQDARAQALVRGSVAIAENAPTLLKAAQDTELRARTRYDVGLGNIVEVAEAERLLTRAEVEYDLAGLGIWRAILSTASAHGDLTPLMQSVANASVQRK